MIQGVVSSNDVAWGGVNGALSQFTFKFEKVLEVDVILFFPRDEKNSTL